MSLPLRRRREVRSAFFLPRVALFFLLIFLVQGANGGLVVPEPERPASVHIPTLHERGNLSAIQSTAPGPKPEPSRPSLVDGGATPTDTTGKAGGASGKVKPDSDSASRTDYIASIEKDMRRWKQRIELVSRREKSAWTQRLESLYSDAQSDLDKLKRKMDKRWNSVRSDVDARLDKLERAYRTRVAE